MRLTATATLLALSSLFAASALAAPYEMRFQFAQSGAPSLHTFVLRWGAPDANLQSIDVLVSDTKEIIQTIAVPQEGVRLFYKDLVNQTPGTVKDQFIESIDYDFDKYADLRLTREWPYKVGAKHYLVWLYDEEKNQYVLNDAISALQSPWPNPRTQRIETVTLGGFGGGEFVKRAFSIDDRGKIRVEAKVTQSLVDPDKMLFMRDVRVRSAGELQRICKIEVKAEGMPKRVWGRKSTCKPYMDGPETPAPI